MKKGQKDKLYRWLDNQILAIRLINKPLDSKNPFYVCNCNYDVDGNIHIYNIDNLCKELNIPYQMEEFDSEKEIHFFIYKGYKFYGLVKKKVQS